MYLAGFVDDINIYANLFQIDHFNVNNLIQQLQDDIQRFCHLLWTTGGKLEPRKCNYTLMLWKFTEDGSPYLDNTIYKNIGINNVEGNICSNIKYLCPDQASKYLGHYKEVSGSQEAQEKVLQSIVRNETAFVSTSQMTPPATHLYYTTMFLKKLHILSC